MPAGEWLKVAVRIAGRDVVARLWKAQVGRVPVYLLDTNCAENAPSDRDITHRLYGGDDSTRVRQEMIFGIGGVRALRALGVQPAVWHLNEGHAAFLILELLREHLAHGLPFNAALEAVAADCVFTTHTPVAAGHDAFGHDLIVAHFGDFVRELGVPIERVLELARAPSAPGLFNMTRLALNGTRHVNGVEPHPWRGLGAAVRRSVAGGAARGQSGRLRHQRRARADLPAPDLDGLLRSRAGPRVARAAARSRVLARARAGAGRRATGRPRRRSRRACWRACASGCSASTSARV